MGTERIELIWEIVRRLIDDMEREKNERGQINKLWDPVQKENVRSLVQKLLRISRWWQSIKLSSTSPRKLDRAPAFEAGSKNETASIHYGRGAFIYSLSTHYGTGTVVGI